MYNTHMKILTVKIFKPLWELNILETYFWLPSIKIKITKNLYTQLKFFENDTIYNIYYSSR